MYTYQVHELYMIQCNCVQRLENVKKTAERIGGSTFTVSITRAPYLDGL